MTELCRNGRHLLTEYNKVSFPGSKVAACRACERFYLTNFPDKFWYFKELNLRRDNSDELWAARCKRYVEALEDGRSPMPRLKTHCANGHEYVGESFNVSRNGWRRCPTCNIPERQNYQD